MSLSVFCAPGKYVQGENATEFLGAEIKKLALGSRVFILAGSSAVKLLEEVWASTFSQAGLQYHVLKFTGECTTNEIERVKQEATSWQADVIVGSGGGKVLDAARAVACDLDLAVVNCPSVASSDAPCSALSVVYTEDGQFERYLFYKRNPELVLVDTKVIAQAPKRLLVAGMGDALATWFEARAVRESGKQNQVGGQPTKSATFLAKLCYETLLEDGLEASQAVEENVANSALERLVEANTLLSGLGFESGGLAVAHSVHNGLTTLEETHAFYHGEKVAFGALVQLVLEQRGDDEIKEVLSFSKSVGLPICFEQLGVDDLTVSKIELVAERTVAPGETAHNEPFKVDALSIASALKEANALGQSFK